MVHWGMSRRSRQPAACPRRSGSFSARPDSVIGKHLRLIAGLRDGLPHVLRQSPDDFASGGALSAALKAGAPCRTVLLRPALRRVLPRFLHMPRSKACRSGLQCAGDPEYAVPACGAAVIRCILFRPAAWLQLRGAAPCVRTSSRRGCSARRLLRRDSR